tara:strand:- start:255 stop:479 length:225 start_codon:yes stop_codon:yes gene_type:complete
VFVPVVEDTVFELLETVLELLDTVFDEELIVLLIVEFETVSVALVEVADRANAEAISTAHLNRVLTGLFIACAY